MPGEFRYCSKYCENCGGKLLLHNTRDIQRKRFCSRHCRNKGIVRSLGWHHTEETRGKMKQSKLALLAKGWKPTGWLMYLSPTRISKHHNYRFVGHRREHTILVEQRLGRALMPNEIVHHLDGNKLNNALDNLQVMARGEHTKLHTQGRLSYVTW